MANKLIRLTESDLHRIVEESVNKVLNEIDYSSMPTGDFTERNNWWKTQVDNDFPNHGIENSKDWQQQYDRLEADKKNQDKLNAKKEKENARIAKQAEKKAAKMARSQARREKHSLYEKAVGYTLYGDDFLTSYDRMRNLTDDEWNDWSDGLEFLPVCLRRQNAEIKAEIFGVGLNNVSYDSEGYDYVCEWGITWGEEDGQGAGIVIGVMLSPSSQALKARVLYCSNKEINTAKSSILITNYISRQVRKNMKNIGERITKWKDKVANI